MNKKGKVDWSKIDGSSPKPKRLHLEKDETDSLYHCPIHACDHDGFKSQRGCRKHVNTKHSWFFFFDKKPGVSITKQIVKRCLKFVKFCYEHEEELSAGLKPVFS